VASATSLGERFHRSALAASPGVREAARSHVAARRASLDPVLVCSSSKAFTGAVISRRLASQSRASAYLARRRPRGCFGFGPGAYGAWFTRGAATRCCRWRSDGAAALRQVNKVSLADDVSVNWPGAVPPRRLNAVGGAVLCVRRSRAVPVRSLQSTQQHHHQHRCDNRDALLTGAGPPAWVGAHGRVRNAVSSRSYACGSLFHAST
jgi:hypothetical protein